MRIYNKKLKAYTLLELIISNTIVGLILITTLHYCVLICSYYIKIQYQWDYINSKLAARHWLLSDLRKGANYLKLEQQLVIEGPRSITYELRPSITPKSYHMHSLALYRKEGDDRFIALCEGITDWTISAHERHAFVKIKFKDLGFIEVNI